MLKLILAVFTVCSLLFPPASHAVERDVLLDRIDNLSQEVERLKQQVEEMEASDAVQDKKIVSQEEKIKDVEYNANKAADISRFNLFGDYRFRVDSIRAKFPAQHTYYYPAMGFGSDKAFTAENDSIMTHRFRLNIEAPATDNIGFVGKFA